MSVQPTSPGPSGDASMPTGADAGLVITPAAISKLSVYSAENPEFAGKHFRVFIEGGGCSGFRYGFGFDDPGEDDFAFDCSGLKVTVDPLSMQYLRGATVDYVDNLQGSGFVVQNPNAKTSCGCGHSFGG